MQHSRAQCGCLRDRARLARGHDLRASWQTRAAARLNDRDIPTWLGRGGGLTPARRLCYSRRSRSNPRRQNLVIRRTPT